MIDNRELRIGNYVQETLFTNRVAQITSITKNRVHLRYEFSRASVSIKYIKPIPLTKLILIQSGFELIGVNWHFEGKNIWKCRDMFICDRFGTEIKYVHELQNWYYVNSNKKELTIQL